MGKGRKGQGNGFRPVVAQGQRRTAGMDPFSAIKAFLRLK